jgi:hypothetical protein
MGVLKKLTSEYFGETERLEDRVVMNGVERVDFIDNNGVEYKNGYRVKDGDRDILYNLIYKLIGKRGYECDLNDIDTSNVKDMHGMFANSSFNGDISRWDVSNVVHMEYIFAASKFTGENGDISKWDVSSAENMNGMFYYTEFAGDISGWEPLSLKSMFGIFDDSPLEKNPPEWYYNKRKK